jgi:polyribonucleotide nucleotidyltransferase
MNPNKFDIQLTPERVLTLSTGQLAPQANGAVLAQLGNSLVLATVVQGAVDKAKDYFPLQVEFQDKLYAGGLIKGGKWIKREGGPSDASVLFGRIIDRSIRPLFPAGYKHEVQLIVTVLSNDKNSDLVTAAFFASVGALMISSIPFTGPVTPVRVGLIDQKPVLFPTLSEMASSELDLFVCRDHHGINMIEANANIVKNDLVLDCINLAEETGKTLNIELEKFAKEFGKPKFDFVDLSPTTALLEEVEALIKDDLLKYLSEGSDGAHVLQEEALKTKVNQAFKSKVDSGDIEAANLTEALDLIFKRYFRAQTLSGKRYDSRALNEVRPLRMEVGVLPCVHGSAIFERGLTQAVTSVTLGALSEQQYLQDSFGEITKRYIHYYSAAPFSTGQTGRTGRPGRREIGHGALAEKALVPVIPSIEDFPYTIALTSEVMSQNGSSSMASTCGSTLSMLDAGVPLKAKVAGISVGMVSDESDKFLLLTDIAGVEDHHGDMDFKITGTREGITAIQLDIKRSGLTPAMITDTFTASTLARLSILDAMDKAIDGPRSELSPFAPKIKLVVLPEDKIGEVIGSGGKTIRGLMEKYDVQIDIDDDGKASISSPDMTKVDAAATEIEAMIREVQVGEDFEGVVTRVENFGAFVEFLPGREALLHVSEMTQGYLSDPSSIIKIGDKLKVKVSGFNDNHQIKLSAPEFKAAHPQGDGSAPPQRPGGFRPPQRDNRPRQEFQHGRFDPRK